MVRVQRLPGLTGFRFITKRRTHASDISFIKERARFYISDFCAGNPAAGLIEGIVLGECTPWCSVFPDMDLEREWRFQ